MDQPSFADLEQAGKKHKTRRQVFLERLERLVPWEKLEARIEPYYPKAGQGRRPYPLPLMLRTHVVQVTHNLSDPAMEDLLYEAASVRRFVGLSQMDPIPDESTLLHFRHLLERHDLGQGLFQEINEHLAALGFRLREGTVIDATIIQAPSSTKNRREERDPEMHQTRKGNQYHFGMKLHVGADAETGLVHSFTTTPANVHDITQAHQLLHGGEKRVWGDAGYIGVAKRPEILELDQEVDWVVSMRRGQRRKLPPEGLENWGEKQKSSTRAKVEHPFHKVKLLFGYAKVRYRGLNKNTQRLAVLLGLGNLLTVRHQLAP